MLPSTVSKKGVLSNSKARSTTSSPAPVPTCQNANLEKREGTYSERDRGTLPWFPHFSLLAPSTPALEDWTQDDFEVEEQVRAFQSMQELTMGQKPAKKSDGAFKKP